jgi:prolyl 4-hydroxylase
MLTEIEELSAEYMAVMPKEEDLHGAALALIRLQDTYNLNVSEMANGEVSGTQGFIHMTGNFFQSHKVANDARMIRLLIMSMSVCEHKLTCLPAHRSAARDCLYLGKHSFNNGYYGQALEWFEEALNRAHQEGNTTAPVDEIRPFYAMAATIVRCYEILRMI